MIAAMATATWRHRPENVGDGCRWRHAHCYRGRSFQPALALARFKAWRLPTPAGRKQLIFVHEGAADIGGCCRTRRAVASEPRRPMGGDGGECGAGRRPAAAVRVAPVGLGVSRSL